MQGMLPFLLSLGLKRNPFPPTPDASSYFFTTYLQEQFAEIQHCVEAHKGFVLVTGEVGLGKSTLVRRLLDALPQERTVSALILNTFLQGGDLLAAILRDFGLPSDGNLDADLSRLNAFLLAQDGAGKTCLLIIDDAQNLNVESLELVRLLCNLETGQRKLLQILLAGQPELETILAQPRLRQLCSRIVKHARLRGLRRDEVVRYFDFRVTACGGSGHLTLAHSAARQLYAATQGNLRQLHLVLERCLYGLSATQKRVIDKPLLSAARQEIAQQSVVRKSRWRAAWVFGTALLGVGVVVAALLPVPYGVPAPHEEGARMAVGEGLTCRDAIGSEPHASLVISQPVSALVAGALRMAPGVCLQQRERSTWATWVADPLSMQPEASQHSERTLLAQKKLAQLGLLSPAWIDGLPGEITAASVQAFQQRYSLPPTGRLDPLTYLLLEQDHEN